MRLQVCVGIVVSAVLGLWAVAAHAYWVSNGVCVCTALYNQGAPVIAGDGAGGAVLVWRDPRSATYLNYAQKLTAAGEFVWDTHGKRVSGNTCAEAPPAVVTDGAGGAIIAWTDCGGLVVQRMDAAGNLQWGPNGTIICPASYSPSGPVLASDEAGGAIVVWSDLRSTRSIYAQRMSADGVECWTTNGVPACPGLSGEQVAATVARDGSHGAVVAWNCGGDIYAQRFDADGNLLWTSSGVAVCTASYEQTYPDIDTDELGGAVIAWRDERTGHDYNRDVYVQRVHASGNILWTANGVAVSTDTGNDDYVRVVSDGAYGAICAWARWSSPGEFDIWAQRVDALGNVMWTDQGAPVTTYDWNQWELEMISDGEGGAIVTWQCDRTSYGNIYAQRLDPTGERLWALPQNPVCTAPYDQLYPAITSDGMGGAVIVWQDGRNYNEPDIWAQRILSTGAWVSPPPVVTAVEDVPNDQGGWARVRFNKSGFDIVQGTTDPVNRYHVYRRNDGPAYQRVSGGSAETLCQTVAAMPPGNWECVATAPAHQSDQYICRVPTVADSAETITYSVYCVQAVTASDTMGYWSAPDSGYSVDNITPSAPEGFALYQNTPNPFNPQTTIRYDVPAGAGRVTLRIYDVSGRLVRELVDEPREADRYAVSWDGRDDRGQAVASGVYLYRLTSGTFVETRKLVLIR